MVSAFARALGANRRRTSAVPITFKSAGAKVETATSTLAVPIPALVAGDYAVMVIGTSTVTALAPGNGWAEFGTPVLDGGGYYHFLWKKATGTEAAGNQNVGLNTSTIGFGSCLVFQGDSANTAPSSVLSVSNGSSGAYPSPSISTAGMWAMFALIYAARSIGASYPTTGSLAATSTVGLAAFGTMTAFTGRWASYSSIVTGGTGTVAPPYASSTSTSTAFAILIPPA